jgi:hypothetical protein
MLYTGYICLRRGTNAFDLLKMRRISAPDVQVVPSHYRIYLVRLVPYLSSLLFSVMVCVTDAIWKTNRRPIAGTRNKQQPTQFTISSSLSIIASRVCRMSNNHFQNMRNNDGGNKRKYAFGLATFFIQAVLTSVHNFQMGHSRCVYQNNIVFI